MAMLCIKNGTILSCVGENVLNNASLFVSGDKIISMGACDDIDRQSQEIITVDAKGGFILPGFIDCHVHMNMEMFCLEDWFIRPFSYNFFRPIKFMRKTILSGITTVRDAGGVDAGMKRAVEEGIICSPRIQISINVISMTGGHGDNYLLSGVDPDATFAYPGYPDGRCDGPEGALKKCREMLRSGAEVIKVCATGGVLSPSDASEDVQFSLAELQAIVQEAARHGNKKVMAHAQGALGIKQAVLAGVHSIEHGVYLDDECIDLMLEHGTFLIPTLYATESLTSDPKVISLLPRVMLDKAKRCYEVHQKNISRAYQAGVKIAMGTDAGMMPHGRNLNELRLLVEIGMSPMEAILASTRCASECLGWEQRIGTLEPGKIADIVIMKDDPRKNINRLPDDNFITTIIKDGKLIKQDQKYVFEETN